MLWCGISSALSMRVMEVLRNAVSVREANVYMREMEVLRNTVSVREAIAVNAYEYVKTCTCWFQCMSQPHMNMHERDVCGLLLKNLAAYVNPSLSQTS